MFDFPASPALGQAFYAPNGPVYVWDGVTWQAQPGSAVANVLWSDTAPVAPFNGQLWGNSLTGILYSWYTDPNSSQWVAISGGAPASVKTARTRNRVINPTAQVSQENGSTAQTTSGAYVADQWYITLSGIVFSSQRTTLPTSSPEGTTTGVSITATTAKGSLAAGDFMSLLLPIEGLDLADLGWGAAGAKAIVLRFCAICDQVGTFAFSIANRPAADRTYLGSFTIAQAGVPQVFSFAIPGDVTGTWLKDTGVGMQLKFNYAVGSTGVGATAGWNTGNPLAPPGCSNGAAVANAKLYLTDVGLYSDPDNTGVAPRFEAPSYEDDLARCKRYWQYLYPSHRSWATGAGQIFSSTVTFSVEFRALPSFGAGAGGIASNTTSVVFNNIANNMARYEFTSVAAGDAYAMGIRYPANARLI